MAENVRTPHVGSNDKKYFRAGSHIDSHKKQPSHQTGLAPSELYPPHSPPPPLRMVEHNS